MLSGDSPVRGGGAATTTSSTSPVVDTPDATASVDISVRGGRPILTDTGTLHTGKGAPAVATVTGARVPWTKGDDSDTWTLPVGVPEPAAYLPF